MGFFVFGVSLVLDIWFCIISDLFFVFREREEIRRDVFKGFRFSECRVEVSVGLDCF